MHLLPQFMKLYSTSPNTSCFSSICPATVHLWGSKCQLSFLKKLVLYSICEQRPLLLPTTITCCCEIQPAHCSCVPRDGKCRRGGAGGGGGCWLVDQQQHGAAWRGSSLLAGAQLVLNHSKWSASAVHSQLTSGLRVCTLVCECARLCGRV